MDYLEYADFVVYKEPSEGHLLEIFPVNRPDDAACRPKHVALNAK